jgi:WD40 repeat protein
LGDQFDAETLNHNNVTAERIREDLSSPPELYSRLPELSVLQPDVRIVDGSMAQVAISPDSTQLAISSASKGGALQLVKLSGEVVQTWPIDTTCFVPRLQFSPDGSSLAGQIYGVVKGPSNQFLHWGTVTIWKIGDPNGRDLLPRQRITADAFCWLRGQRWIAVGLNNSIVILDAVTGQRVATTAEPMPHCVVLAAPPGGEFLATGHDDGSVGIWEVPSVADLESNVSAPIKKLSLAKQHGSAIVDLEVSSDGKRLASSSDKDRVVWLWDTTTRGAIKRFDGRRLAISADGQLLVTSAGVTADRIMGVWSTETGEPVARIPDKDSRMFFDAIFSPDGSKLFGLNQKGILRTWGFRQNGEDSDP